MADIDDDWTVDEGETLPALWWRLEGRIPLTVRTRTGGHIPGYPLLAFGPEFYDELSVYGPRYLDLSHFTRWDAYRGQQGTVQRAAYEALQATHPDTFSTVVDGTGPERVWLALRLTRLTDQIVDTLIAVHDRTCTRAHY